MSRHDVTSKLCVARGGLVLTPFISVIVALGGCSTRSQPVADAATQHAGQIARASPGTLSRDTVPLAILPGGYCTVRTSVGTQETCDTAGLQWSEGLLYAIPGSDIGQSGLAAAKCRLACGDAYTNETWIFELPGSMGVGVVECRVSPSAKLLLAVSTIPQAHGGGAENLWLAPGAPPWPQRPEDLQPVFVDATTIWVQPDCSAASEWH